MGGSVALAAKHSNGAKPSFISFLSNVFTRRKKDLPDLNAGLKKERGNAEKKHNVSFAALDKYHHGVVMHGRNNEAALNAFSEAIAIKPDCWYFYKDRAKAYKALGKNDLAQKDLKAARDHHPKNNL